MRAARRASAQKAGRAGRRSGKALLVFEAPMAELSAPANNDRPWASTVVWAPIRAAEDLRDTS
jgi:hypothetical protein